MKRIWSMVLLLWLLASLTACGQQQGESEPTQAAAESTAATQPTATEPQKPPLPELWVGFEDVIVHPFIQQELDEAYETARRQMEKTLNGAEVQWLCLSFDPILTHHDCVQACAANINPQWELEHYFANTITLSYRLTTFVEDSISIPPQGSIRLTRQSDRELWYPDEVTELRCEQSGWLCNGSDLAVCFDDSVTGYVLADGTLMAYCRDSQTGEIALQTGKLPWGGGSEPMGSEPYFARNRGYTEAELYGEPGWLSGGLSIGEGEDGLLGLYRNGELLWTFFDASCDYRLCESWIYYLDGTSVNRMDYFGRNRQTLFTGEALSSTFYVAQDTVFFICQSEGQSGVYRLYAPDGRCELLSAQIPVSLVDVGLEPPISNNEIVWSYIDPDFLELAEEQRQSYEAQYGELDNITYYGMLERDQQVYSQILCYLNTLTQEYYELRSGWVYLQPDRTPENVEQNGSAWWKDFQSESETAG